MYRIKWNRRLMTRCYDELDYLANDSFEYDLRKDETIIFKEVQK